MNDYTVVGELCSEHDSRRHGSVAKTFCYSPPGPVPIEKLVGRVFEVVKADTDNGIVLREVAR